MPMTLGGNYSPRVAPAPRNFHNPRHLAGAGETPRRHAAALMPVVDLREVAIHLSINVTNRRKAFCKGLQ